MYDRERFIALLDSQPLQKGDAIVVMQGDGLSRAGHAVEILKNGFARTAVIVGSADNRSYGSFPSREIRDEMIRLGAPDNAVFCEEKVGAHTRAEAERAVQVSKEKNWKTALIVTSPHHQYRTFLTFLKAMKDAEYDLTLINAPAPLSWFEINPWGRRIDLLTREFDKIDEYQKKGDVASYQDGIEYLENQV